MGFTISLEEYLKEPGVTEVWIPDNVTKILTTPIPDGVTSVAIPKSVTEIEADAFICKDLLFITVDPDNPEYCDIDGVLYSKDKTVLVRYPRGRQDAEYVIPDHVTAIEDGAFAYCANLSTVKLSNNLETIGSGAFLSCGLTSIDLPNSVTEIGARAFADCKKLTSVRIPHGVTAIYRATFSACLALRLAEIPDSVTKISDDAFFSQRVTILTKHGSYAEDYAQKKEIRVSYASLEDYRINSDAAEIKIPDSITVIECDLIPPSKSITSVLIHKGVTEISEAAFDNCIALTSIKVDPDNPNFCDIDGVLYSKDKTVLVRYPRGRQDTFAIPSHVKAIGDSAFAECEFLTEIHIPNNITEIGYHAFTGCRRLTSVSLPNSITQLNSMVFAKCSSLSSVVIPDSVTAIGNYAFRECENLTSVFVSKNVTEIAEMAASFSGCPHLTITAPSGSFAIEYAVKKEISYKEI